MTCGIGACLLKRRPAGSSDIYARYENPDGTLAFRVVAEVSSQKVINKEFYMRQLNQAWKFADKLAEDEEDGLVYGLVINGGRIGSNTTLRRLVSRLCAGKGDEAGRKRSSASSVCGRFRQRRENELRKNLPEGRLQFSAGLFGGILDSLINMLLPKIETFVGDDWMRDKLVEMVAEGETVDPADHHDPN